MKQWRLLLPPLLSIILILATSAIVIAYGKGYRPGIPQEGNQIVRPTGLLSTTSDPVGAQVFLNSELRTATNNSVNVDPGTHTVRITKEGYLPWQKEIRVEKEVVSRADAFLFPLNPSLSPLTNTGIIQPSLSPDGTKIAYLIPPVENEPDSQEKAGVWIYNLADRPLGINRDQRQIGTWQPLWKDGTINFYWSPDSEQLIVDTNSFTDSRLYEVGRSNESRLTNQGVTQLLRDWDEESQLIKRQQLEAFKQPFIDVATSSARIIAFSPDETKLLYEATASATIQPVIIPPLIGSNSTEEQREITPGKLYVYDSKEDKNYLLFDVTEILPSPSPTPTSKKSTRIPTPTPLPPIVSESQYPIRWFPTNRHLVLTLPGKIDIVEYDRTNWVTVYAGPFIENFVAPWPGGSRIIIVTNLNPSASLLPNLYTVNLR